MVSKNTLMWMTGYLLYLLSAAVMALPQTTGSKSDAVLIIAAAIVGHILYGLRVRYFR